MSELSREQVEIIAGKIRNEYIWKHEVNYWLGTDAALRATITQQAQELEQVKKERDAFQVGQLEVAKFLGYGVGAQLSLQSFIMQQLAASQARCREMEADRSIKMNESRKFASYVVAHSSKKSARHNAHYAELICMAERHLERAKDIPSTTPWLLEMMEVARRDKQELPQLLFQANETIAQLQATLAAREARIAELETRWAPIEDAARKTFEIESLPILLSGGTKGQERLAQIIASWHAAEQQRDAASRDARRYRYLRARAALDKSDKQRITWHIPMWDIPRCYQDIPIKDQLDKDLDEAIKRHSSP